MTPQPSPQPGAPTPDARELRRLERCELHRSRSLSASIALWLTALAVAAVAALLLLERTGTTVPGATLPGSAEIASLAGGAGAVGIAIGAAAGLVGLAMLILALAPGRRSRRALQREGVAIVADDAVLASAISRAAALASRAPVDRTRTTLGRTSAEVALRPPSGFATDTAAADEAARALIEALRPRPTVRVVVREERDA
ncbi:threonine dehydrogenase-like Zn-dependent dehydrogenase [Agrococcus sp. UYP10]|uniref:hypothetical protein n=1 Tax=Agrococcus sp. UYP10 TaxID=1756355 RepID=UPI0033932F28